MHYAVFLIFMAFESLCLRMLQGHEWLNIPFVKNVSISELGGQNNYQSPIASQGSQKTECIYMTVEEKSSLSSTRKTSGSYLDVLDC